MHRRHCRAIGDEWLITASASLPTTDVLQTKKRTLEWHNSNCIDRRSESCADECCRCMQSDAERVVQALGLSFDHVIAFGRSMGSLYANELAARWPTRAAVVIESGIADPAERFLNYADLDAASVSEADIRAEVARHFDHQRKLASYRNPVLILHAMNDHLITLSHAERNLRWSGSSLTAGSYLQNHRQSVAIRPQIALFCFQGMLVRWPLPA